MAAARDARIDVRLPEDLKQSFEIAAAYLGQSLSEFVISTVRVRALEVQSQRDKTLLTNRDRALFLAALDETNPSEALLRSARKYKQLVEEGGPDVDDRVADSSPR